MIKLTGQTPVQEERKASPKPQLYSLLSRFTLAGGGGKNRRPKRPSGKVQFATWPSSVFQDATRRQKQRLSFGLILKKEKLHRRNPAGTLELAGLLR
ncbi:hypothetical protein QNN00_18620 [Bacillus velezensis]|nr:hypothetical protein [Bacillus velezensis]